METETSGGYHMCDVCRNGEWSSASICWSGKTGTGKIESHQIWAMWKNKIII